MSATSTVEFAYATADPWDNRITKPFSIVAIPVELRGLEDDDGFTCLVYHEGEEIAGAWETTRQAAIDSAIFEAQMKYMNLSRIVWAETN